MCVCVCVVGYQQLAQQWQSEVVKHGKPGLRCHIVTTLKQHQQLTYQDVMRADIIAVSFQYLGSDAHTSLVTLSQQTLMLKILLSLCSANSNYRISSRGNIANLLGLTEENRTPDHAKALKVAGPDLAHFMWRRLIVGEFVASINEPVVCVADVSLSVCCVAIDQMRPMKSLCCRRRCRARNPSLDPKFWTKSCAFRVSIAGT
jgi:hypothetical protein